MAIHRIGTTIHRIYNSSYVIVIHRKQFIGFTNESEIHHNSIRQNLSQGNSSKFIAFRLVVMKNIIR